MAGMTDVFNRLSLALALWNGKDPILKERMFGLTGPEGNHGEDVKEYWWYLDARAEQRLAALALPLPAGRVPVRGPGRDQRGAVQARARVRADRHRHLRRRPLLDRRGPLRQGDPDRHPDARHRPQPGPGDRHPPRPADALVPQRVGLEPGAGQAAAARGTGRPVDPGEPPRARRLHARDRPRPGRDAADAALLRERDEPRRGSTASRRSRRTRRTGSTTTSSAAPRRSTRTGSARRPRPGTGWTCRPGETAEIRLRLHKMPRAAKPRAAERRDGAAAATAARRSRPPPRPRAATARPRPRTSRRSIRSGPSFESTMRRREAEADDFYAALRREGGTDDEQRIMRQAFAGMLWSKQYYGYNVARWLDGDPGLPPPPPERKHGRNVDLAPLRRRRHHVDARSVGVPVVRGLGPGVPRGDVRPHRPDVREVPAPAAVPRVVPAPERGPARLRVVVRRRQPAGPRGGGLPRLDDRRAHATSSSCGGSSTSSCSTSPGGSTARTRRATTSSRAGSSASTTSAPSTGRTCPPGPSSSSPTRPPGCSSTA